MNDYDDLDECSSENSFRARSNTWPLNRPDFALPSSGANIDETLPEIELEDDDLFTTNENWSTGVIDHDIMSWDPILNAQNHQQQKQQQQQQQQQQQVTNQPPTVHHHHQQQPQQQTQAQHQQLPPPSATTAQQSHQRQPSLHLQLNHHQQQPQQLHHQDPHHIQHRLEHQHQRLQQNDSFHDANHPQGVIVSTQNAQLQHPTPQLQHQTSPQPSAQHIQHQTLNSVHCLDTEDSNEYHLQQLNHLHLDNPPLVTVNDPQQDQFATTLTSFCVHNQVTDLNDGGYNITPNQNHNDHQHHHQHHHHTQPHLQALSSARYDIDPQVIATGREYDVKPVEETLQQQQQQQHAHHLEHHVRDQPQLIHQSHQQHHNHLQHHEQHHSHQIQHHHHSHVASSGLDNHLGGSVMLSSSLGTSGIGLSRDLEDLDYKAGPDQSNLLHQSTRYDGEQPRLTPENQQQQQTSEIQSADNVADDVKQSDSTSVSKTAKQNVPRRNAWGNMSYADLISQAINSTSDKRLTLAQIYDWMVQHVPYFKDKGDSNSSAGWKNSVRHNLSLHSRFKRLQNEGTGKSSWWTINPEANIGKCARRRAASMEASKYEKKRGRAKKRAEAIRQGLVSYPSLTNSSLNGSTSTLEQHPQAPSISQFQPTLQEPEDQPEQETSEQHQPLHLEQLILPTRQPQLQIQTIDQFGIDQPSQQQQLHLQQLQQSDARSCEDLIQQNGQNNQNLFIMASQRQHLQHPVAHAVQQQLHQDQPRYEDNNENNKLQQQQQQQSQYYYQFELSTAL